jgi:RHS repeat-associated protein
VTGPAHTVTNTYEPNRDILDVKENKAGTTTVSKYDYLVNALGQRSNVATSGTAFASSRDITWGYDSFGQVTSADSTIPGLDRAYTFDMIGNRLKTADSLTLPAANNYTPNALNQYTAIGSLNPVHDDDGNMISGPLPANVNANSTLVWDGENRLIQAQVTGGATVNFIYDSQSRRIAETVGTNTKLTVYDGWNPIAEYWRAGLQPASLAKSFTWGIDLSGTLQGAGGVGGLLAVTDSTGTYYPTYDGNGNVSEYLDSTGTVVAHYEYDPFGKTTVASGPKANDFAHRFSTKPLDLTTGLYYYGYRFYDPVTGRWPSRDPIEEEGGLNLYGFVGNNGVNAWDYLGLVDPNVWLDGKDPKPCSPHKYFDYDLDVSKVVLTITASPKYTVINKPKFMALQQNLWVNFGSGSFPSV